MKFLLDTNVISEPTKPRPNKGVMAWLAAVNEDSVFLSVVTITELHYGIDGVTAGKIGDVSTNGWAVSGPRAFKDEFYRSTSMWRTRAADLWRAANLMAEL